VMHKLRTCSTGSRRTGTFTLWDDMTFEGVEVCDTEKQE
jgi:hypothetical protein